MFQFDEPLETLFAQCAPFDESSIRQSEEYKKKSEVLQTCREFLQILDPEVVTCIDLYMNTYLELVDLECRHYFSEGYRLAREDNAN